MSDVVVSLACREAFVRDKREETVLVDASNGERTTHDAVADKK